MSGALVKSYLETFERLFGEQVVRRATSSLPASTQAELDALVAAAWVPVEDVDRLFETYAAITNRPPEELVQEVVASGHRATYGRLWKSLLRLTAPKVLLTRASTMFAKSYSHGVLTAKRTETKFTSLIRLTHWPRISDLRLLGTATGIRTVLELTGRGGVEVSFERTSEGADFAARWGTQSGSS